ncbi:hypothetical protein, partial [Duganella violaceipulchra]|uniref:hypothetical protein n=1 Tax=Duganella violaceipulchra TaxID=2849652 RepID=UPI0021CB98D8
PLPIPNRTVKQLCADDSAATSVKVGYRQASYIEEPHQVILVGFFAFHGHLLSAALPRFSTKKPLPMIWSGLFFVCH